MNAVSRRFLALIKPHAISHCRYARQPLAAWRRRPCRITQGVVERRAVFTAPEPAGVSNSVDTTPHTIYALSTAPGRAAIAVIRVSGPSCLEIYGKLCPDRPLPQPRTAVVRRLYRPTPQQELLDPSALVLYFAAPKSFTGEDVLEIHTHGGSAIVRSVLEAIALADRGGKGARVRYAEPGEFTKRAFYNDRLDLTQAEALGELLAAETDQQHRIAINAAGNQLGLRYEKWRTLLLYARGELEALIDFSEDQHFDESPSEFLRSVTEQITLLRHQISLHVQNSSKGELLRSGIAVALLGAPNAGKSSLLNLIAGREAAIVSSEEGTTRDVVNISLNIGGWLCHFGDTAGLRGEKHSADFPSAAPIGKIEKEGMRRARDRAAVSDLVIVLLSVEKAELNGAVNLRLEAEVIDQVHKCREREKEIVLVVNKADQLGPDRRESVQKLEDDVRKVFPFVPHRDVCFVSCLEARGDLSLEADPGNLQKLMTRLKKSFATMTSPLNSDTIAKDPSYWEDSLSVSHRQSELLRECTTHLDDYIDRSAPGRPNSDSDIDVVAAAEDLRYAANCLARITGKGEAGDVEDVLGVVFEK